MGKDIDFSNLNGGHSRGLAGETTATPFTVLRTRPLELVRSLTDSGNLLYTMSCSYAGGERTNIVCIREGTKPLNLPVMRMRVWITQIMNIISITQTY